MTGKTGAYLNSVLPLAARSARIASGGGAVASAHGFPAGEGKTPSGYFKTGQEPDSLDFPGMAGRRVETSAPRLAASASFEPQPKQKHSP